jgi:hypothetical protein
LLSEAGCFSQFFHQYGRARIFLRRFEIDRDGDMIEAFYRSLDVDREGRNSSVRLSVGPSAFMFHLSNTESAESGRTTPPAGCEHR